MKIKALYYAIPIITGVAAISVGIIASNYSKSLENKEYSNINFTETIEEINKYNNSLSEDAKRLNSKITLISKYLFGQTTVAEGLDINGDMRIDILDLIYIKKARLALETTTTQTTNIITEPEQILTETPAPETQPPITQPPATQPPATQPPATQPPVTQPPATQPPTTQPPVIQPPTTQPPATQPPAPSGISEYQAEVLRLVNVERAAVGLSPLEADLTLMQAAQIRADETVQLFSHTRPNGESCFTVLSELGISYRSCGENIAAGFSTPEQTVNQWMNSEGHRANILNPSFTHLGVGYVNRSGTQYRNYWTQMFVGR